MAKPTLSESCPFCGEPVGRTAERCPHCGEDLYEDEEENDPPPRRRKKAWAQRGLRCLLPIGRSGWSIAAGYLGVLCLIAILGYFYAWFYLHRWGQLGLMAYSLILGTGSGILAVMFGILGLKSTKANPRLGGRGRSILGIIAGSAALVPTVILVLAVFVRIAIRRH